MKSLLSILLLAVTVSTCGSQVSTQSTPPYQKVLFLGNSITLHTPAPDIGWTSNWGMAASLEANDYVHLVLADLAKRQNSKPESMVLNIAAFERAYSDYDIAKELKQAIDFDADLVVLAIGENAVEPIDADAVDAFSKSIERLIRSFQTGEKSPNQPSKRSAKIVVRSCFWPNPKKDNALRQASDRTESIFVDLSSFAGDATLEARSERKIDHAGVAAHPGDKGMRAIAEKILENL